MVKKHKQFNIVVIIIFLTLCVIPFFWFSPNEIEMGGDSNRLFLYDPAMYLRVNALFTLEPEGLGKVRPDHATLPFLALLTILNTIFHSPYVLMGILNSLKLAGSFIFVYLTVIEILKHKAKGAVSVGAQLSGILAGLFYALSPSVGENMRTALLTHNQVFLNPMIFYLMLRYVITKQNKYIWTLLFITVIFSPNFSLIAPPPPFSFYPLALTFLWVYVRVSLQQSIPWKQLFVAALFFIGLHSFHLIPEILYLFDPSSFIHARAFSVVSNQNEGLGYFNAILSLGKVWDHIVMIVPSHAIGLTFFIVPFICILGMIWSTKAKKSLALIGVFFLIALYLASANMTHLGVSIYRLLFVIPGFSMFRNFYGQFQWVHSFFYALLFGFSLFICLDALKTRYRYIVSCLIAVVLIFNGVRYITGEIFMEPHVGSKNMTSVIQLDPDYLDAFKFIRSLPDDGKIFNFPFTDFSYQLIHGVNNGAYMGPSMISYLTEKRNFAGYQNIYPFSEVFLRLIKERDYESIQNLFSLLNVKYIFYVKDPKGYIEYFPVLPFSLLAASVPDSDSLSDVVSHLVGKRVFEQGNYGVYEVAENRYVPHLYVPTNMVMYDQKDDGFGSNASFFINKSSNDSRISYIDRQECKKIFIDADCQKERIFSATAPVVSYIRINPVKYVVRVSGVHEPFVLGFLDNFHINWKAYIVPKNITTHIPRREYSFLDINTFETTHYKSLPESQHFMINGYANAWYVRPSDASSVSEYEIIIEMIGQRAFYLGLAISIASGCIFLLYGIKHFRKYFYES